MIEVKSFKARDKDRGERLDLFLARPALNLSLSRSQIQKLIAGGQVKVNQKPATAHLGLKPGDLVTLVVPEPRQLKAEAQDIPLSVLYEDAHLCVVDKPAGMVTHPAPGSTEGTLVNALLHRWQGALPSMQGALRPGIVHRLDKDTTGCLVVARTEAAFQSLTRQIQERRASRRYLALAWGRFQEDEATVEAPIGRSRGDRKKMAVVRPGDGGREARTHFKVAERFAQAALLELALETGRTHQIRVHLTSIKHPVVGDKEYGSPPSGLDQETAAFASGLSRQMLHAWRLEFDHPATGKRLSVEAPLPADFKAALGFFRGRP